MDIKGIKTDKTKYDIHDKNLVEKIKKDIKVFDDYKGEISLKKICQYIILAYDINSPMIREINNYMQRKNECAITVGFPRGKVGWREDAEKMLIGIDKKFNSLIAAYISNLGLPLYTYLIGLLEIQAIKTKEILNVSIDQHTHKILKDVTESITAITNKLFGSGEYDEILAAKKALYEQSNLDKLMIRPEIIVKEIEEHGELPPDFNPYGDFEVEKSKFIGDSEPEG